MRIGEKGCPPGRIMRRKAPGRGLRPVCPKEAGRGTAEGEGPRPPGKESGRGPLSRRSHFY